MKRIFIILSAMLLAACMKNFDPETDSNLGSVVLSVDLMPVFKDVKVLEEDPDARLRIRAYCYGEDGLLKSNQSCIRTNFNEMVEFEFRHLTKGEEYRLLVFADFFWINEDGSETDCWFHLLTGSINSIHIDRVEGSYGYYDILGMATGAYRLNDSRGHLALAMQHTGTPCIIAFTNAPAGTEIYHAYTGRAMVSPSGNDKYDTSYTFYQTDTVPNGYDSIEFYHYIIPNVTGKSRLDYKVTFNGKEPAQYSHEINVTAGKQLQIEINCLNGELKCTEF